MISEFSTRRKIVEELAQQWIREGKYAGMDKNRLYELATLNSRKKKGTDVTKESLLKSWESVAKELETSLPLEKENAQTVAGTPSTTSKSHLEEEYFINMALKGLTENESVFSRESLLRHSLMVSLTKFSPWQIEKCISELIRKGEIVELSKKAFTTPEMQKIEKEIVEQVRAGKNQNMKFMTSKHRTG